MPAYPILLLGAFVLAKYFESWAPMEALVRPLIGVTTFAVLCVAIAALALGRHRGAFVLALFVTLSFEPILTAVIGVTAIGALVRNLTSRGSLALPWESLTRSLNVVALIIALVTGARGTIEGAAFIAGTPEQSEFGAAPDTAPDVYLLLLDGYPRQDTLMTHLGFENEDFIASMEGLGFMHAVAARANYNSTALTLASMLNGQHVHGILAATPPNLAHQARRISMAINDARYLREFRARGYEIVSIPSPSNYLTLYRADRLMDSGHLSVLEYQLAQEDGPQWLLREELERVFLDQHRHRINSAFQTIEDLSLEPQGEPKLVLAHILAPHPPFVFAADGAPVFVGGCLWRDCSLEKPLTPRLRTGVVDQISYLNLRIRQAAEAIIRNSSRPPVIVLFSDHGLRHDPTDRAEVLRSLLLAYTAGRDAAFLSQATPITYLPRLLNEYFAAGLPLSSEESYFLPAQGGARGFLSLEEVAPAVIDPT